MISREELMLYLDDELAPSERARVEGALESSTELRRELAIFRAMQEDLRGLSFEPRPTDGSVWDRVNRRLTRPVGWLLLTVGLVAWGGVGVYVFWTGPTRPFEKLSVAAVVIGLLLLLISVGREQYRDWLDDPYRDVHR